MDLSILGLAAFGGLLISAVGLLELGSVPKAKRPDFSDPFYWAPFVGWPVIAVVLAYCYIRSGTVLTPFLALNIGASAPLGIKALVSAVPKTKPRRINPGRNA